MRVSFSAFALSLLLSDPLAVTGKTAVVGKRSLKSKSSTGKKTCKGKFESMLSSGSHQFLVNAGVDVKALDNLKTIGEITALIPEASDAAVEGAPAVDGESGDIDFPHGNLKPLATVGEASVCEGTEGEMIVGVPDGLGAYLYDYETVRAIVQSESYGPLVYESYPFPVNHGAATFTGSHVQYVDYDREYLSKFMSKTFPASKMVTGMGEAIHTAYNLKGELVGPRNRSGPTLTGAHYSNTDADGNWVVVSTPSDADWLMQSLCSAHLEKKHQWGDGIGAEDNLFITNEEWMTYEEDVQNLVGLSAHVIDLATYTDYAIGSMTNGGFEKIVEINSLHTDYVIYSVSGYNGAFGSYDNIIANRNEAYGNRTDGKPWVKPQNVVPSRIYIGMKGRMEDGSGAPEDDFLGRNGFRYGKMYGFATDMSESGPTHGLWRDAFHKNETTGYNGNTVEGVFTPIDWQWDGTVKNFEHDGSWDFQEQPPLHAGSNNYFWNANGNDASGCKTEHNTPDPRVGISGFVQTSTCGYYGHYYLNDIKEILDNLPAGQFPGDISATYKVYQGELDITSQIELGGKGQYADGKNATRNYDTVDSAKVTFEDIDGFEVVEGPDEKLYAVIQEDSGNDYGERMFITSELEHEDDGEEITYYFVAMSGGSENTRMAGGVGIPAGVNVAGSSHEFSGIADMSGLVAKDEDGKWMLRADDDGTVAREADRSVAINDKLILIGLQAHNFNAGVIKDLQGDRGGQWLAYQPNIPV